ncbi:hypothetical protein Anas_08513 [Armadillidium nasatum]|uniref:Uncharacterized protein n=1 Tax=Armadillidium nasatum TaxID=96803 RepID=A0A5N5SZR0_9CRUS|nr:hypothetical protein Anas_08513 [Armadillidium nasatum]
MNGKGRDIVRDIKFLYFSVKSKKLNVLIYKLIIIIKNRGFIFRLFLVYGQIITRISVLCDLTSVLYIQNFVPSLQIGNLKEKGSKLILTLKDKVPLILGRFLLGTQLTTSFKKLSCCSTSIRQISGTLNGSFQTLEYMTKPLLGYRSAKGVKIPLHAQSPSGFIPEGYTVHLMPGGGKLPYFNLFLCGWMGTPDNHMDIRETVAEELIKHPAKYQLKGRNITKKLKLLKLPGQLPIPEAILAFANISKCLNT